MSVQRGGGEGRQVRRDYAERCATTYPLADVRTYLYTCTYLPIHVHVPTCTRARTYLYTCTYQASVQGVMRDATMVDQSDGSYLLRWLSDVPGTYSVYVKMDGKFVLRLRLETTMVGTRLETTMYMYMYMYM